MNTRFQQPPEPVRPILITGARGTLGSAFARLCHCSGLAYQSLSRQEMDITDPASVEAALEQYQPWAVINAAGFVQVERAEQAEEQCFLENTAGPALLATVCAKRKLSFLTFSSDLIFNGRQGEPYLECDRPTPKNTYGHSKAKAETLVQEILPSALIVRTSALFCPWDRQNFLTVALRELAAKHVLAAANDVLISPTYVPDLVQACLNLLIAGESGLWHLANSGAVTWAEFAKQAANQAGLNAGLIEETPVNTLHFKAVRPVYSVLGSQRGELLSPLGTALNSYLRDCGIWRAARREPSLKCWSLQPGMAEAKPEVTMRNLDAKGIAAMGLCTADPCHCSLIFSPLAGEKEGAICEKNEWASR